MLPGGSGCLALVTSRVPLRVRGERELRIAPLEVRRPGDDPDDLTSTSAVQLFADRAAFQPRAWVLAHMTSETARHAGHADILREPLDGTTGR